jgi:hypothetical protein
MVSREGRNLSECLRVLRVLVRFFLGLGICDPEVLSNACPALVDFGVLMW